MTDWCILRCSNQATIPLLKSLPRDGIEVWSPVEQITRRVPRATVKRTVDSPMLPSYIFARSHHLPELVTICDAPPKRHHAFRVFRHNGKLPLIADDTLAPLRLLERKAKPARPEAALRPGDAVHMVDGGFAGMSGVVEQARGQFAMVRLNGFNVPLKIASFYLLHNDSKNGTQRAA